MRNWIKQKQDHVCTDGKKGCPVNTRKEVGNEKREMKQQILKVRTVVISGVEVVRL